LVVEGYWLEQDVESFVMHKLTFVISLVVGIGVIYLLHLEAKKLHKNPKKA